MPRKFNRSAWSVQNLFQGALSTLSAQKFSGVTAGVPGVPISFLGEPGVPRNFTVVPGVSRNFPGVP